MNGRCYLQMQLACAEIDASVFFELSFLQSTESISLYLFHFFCVLFSFELILKTVFVCKMYVCIMYRAQSCRIASKFRNFSPSEYIVIVAISTYENMFLLVQDLNLQPSHRHSIT